MREDDRRDVRDGRDSRSEVLANPDESIAPLRPPSVARHDHWDPCLVVVPRAGRAPRDAPRSDPPQRVGHDVHCAHPLRRARSDEAAAPTVARGRRGRREVDRTGPSKSEAPAANRRRFRVPTATTFDPRCASDQFVVRHPREVYGYSPSTSTFPTARDPPFRAKPPNQRFAGPCSRELVLDPTPPKRGVQHRRHGGVWTSEKASNDSTSLNAVDFTYVANLSRASMTASTSPASDESQSKSPSSSHGLVLAVVVGASQNCASRRRNRDERMRSAPSSQATLELLTFYDPLRGSRRHPHQG